TALPSPRCVTTTSPSRASSSMMEASSTRSRRIPITLMPIRYPPWYFKVYRTRSLGLPSSQRQMQDASRVPFSRRRPNPRLLAVITCPRCGKESPEGFKFCPHCAAPLTAAPSREAEERKVVTVLFCDLVGFTSASDRADPEDVRARLRPYHSMLKREIERYGGTVEKFIGDAVMAVFGAPVAHEDDAERAVRAALRITEAIPE